PVDTHIPHEAESFRPAQEAGGRALPAQFPLAPAAATRRHGARPSRPITLFSPPEPIETLAAIPDGPPVRFKWRRVSYQVVAAEGPERIAQKWWEHEAAPTFDYYAVEDETGCRFWIYREGLYGRETNEPRWFMHGLFP
ncbi:MAG: DNA polymerase Y family protein, partial [Pseudomonadota bacterium]